MKEILDTLVQKNRTVSLLILLDEADSFYHAQLKSPETALQRSLSWWMSRHAEHQKDRAKFPRIRFVLCGYQHTGINGGVWQNSGDVIRLGPLESRSAVRLVAGPLARMGIDASEVADSIAFRCGYQPVVILRFGLQLVKHLQTTRARQTRDNVRVTPKDVTEVMYDQDVQTEVRSACWLNFVGHPNGQLVFAALLLEWRARPPGAEIVDIADVVLRQVQAVDPGFQPTQLFDEDWNGNIEKEAGDLVRRSLLIVVSHRPKTYRLRFPHHLPILIHDPDPVARIKDALIRAIAERQGARPQWVLGDAVLEGVNDCLGGDGQEIGVEAVAITTLWPAPLLDRDDGLMVRIDCETAGVFKLIADTAAVAWVAQKRSSGERAVLIGGLRLAHALSAADDACDDIVIQRTGRLTSEQIWDWFKRRRAAEFTGLQAPDRIMEATGGIPLLVGELDRLLTDEWDKAPTLGEQDLARLLKRLKDELPKLAKALAPGEGEQRLTSREVELLRLYILTASKWGEDFAAAMRDISLLDETDAFAIPPYSPADDSALRVLLTIGLLPRSMVRHGTVLDDIAPLPAADMLIELVKLLGE